MKFLILSYSLIFIATNSMAQKDIKSIDSLVRLIEGKNNLLFHSICDTAGASHDTLYVAYCMMFYYNNDSLFKSSVLITRSSGNDYQFIRADTISLHVFYYFKDSLIKSVENNLSNSIKRIDEYYFIKPSLKTEDETTDYSSRTKFQISFAMEQLRHFKEFTGK
jgi:hypothetical protein